MTLTHIDAFKESVKLTAYSIMKEGDELLPVLATYGPTGAAFYALSMPKAAWGPAVALVVAEKRPYIVAFLSAAHVRVLEKGEKAEVRPKDDPKASDQAVIIFKEQGRAPEYWSCDYKLTSRGKIVQLGEWKSEERSLTSSGFLRFAFSLL